MTDAEYRKALLRIRKAVGKWHDALGLGWWRITYAYDREGEMADGKDRAARNVAGTAAVDWRYKYATITFNIPILFEMNDEDLERVIMHEQVHVLVNELREEGIDHEERVVSELTSAFKWVEEHKFGKKPIAAPKK